MSGAKQARPGSLGAGTPSPPSVKRPIIPATARILLLASNGRSCSESSSPMKTTLSKASDASTATTSQRPFSSRVLDGPDRAHSRAMLYPVGFKPEDFSKPVVGIASAWSMVTPCNMHLDQLAREAEAGANAAGGKAIIFDTITVSDGISMGTEGMKYSLVSREVIADSIETVVGCEGMDGFVAIGGCDKNMPGSLIAIARLTRPAALWR